MAKCTAISKRSGKQCRRPASHGRIVCHIHGGKSPRGLAHPSMTHGRLSKHVPRRMLADYQARAELLRAIETRRRLVETERRRLEPMEPMEQVITSDQAMLLVVALVGAVRRHVDDRGVLDAIGREVEQPVAVEGVTIEGRAT